jgi:hypothetical protein
MSERLFDMAPERLGLADRFGVPPFSVFDTRQGYWQERKRQWIALGIRSELGRGDDLLNLEGTAERQRKYKTMGAIPANQNDMLGYRNGDVPLARDLYGASNLTGAAPLPEWANNGTSQMTPGTSIFDPVLCEMIYRWYSPHGGTVLDPFAGGSVRGIVASVLERIYVGIDLSERQIDANRENALALHGPVPPTWVHGDSREVQKLAPGEYDLVFSCPPYTHLERYSEDERDLSTYDYPRFLTEYGSIIERTCSLLRPDRFACFVVSEVRHPQQGHYHGLVPDTIRLFQEAGLSLYNEAILVNPVGTLAMRTLRQFPPGRKLGRTHQNVLIFVKGDGRRAADACGQLELVEEALT